MTSHPEDFAEDRGGEPAPVFRDRRRIDPVTGEVRKPPADEPTPSAAGEAAPAEPAANPADTAALEGAAAALAEERLADLQRLQAEFVNYRKRVERDRNLARDNATSAVIEALLPALDDIELARQHGDLASGPFAAIAEKLENALGRFGLQRYGAVGEEFDPTVHDALLHSHSDDVTVTTVTQVMQPGYKVNDKVVRPARVGVSDPE